LCQPGLRRRRARWGGKISRGGPGTGTGHLL